MLDQFLIVQAIYTASIMALVACNLYQSSRAKKMETALRQATSAMHSALEKFHLFITRDREGAAVAAKELVKAMNGLELQEQAADKDLDG